MALLEQKIPAIYIELERVVQKIAQERKQTKKDPVLHTQEYRSVSSSLVLYLIAADNYDPMMIRMDRCENELLTFFQVEH